MKSQSLRGTPAVLVGLAALVLSACGGGSTTFVSAWRSPKAEPLEMKGKPVAAVVIMQNEGTRRNAEDVLAREITHYGARGIPMYTLFAGSGAGNEAAARAALESARVKGAVVLRPMGVKKNVETHQAYSGSAYGGYWGGYYPYAWSNAWGPPGGQHRPEFGAPAIYVPPASGGVETYTTTTEVVEVEVLVYSFEQNMLVWVGRSETTEAKKVDEFVTRLAAATVKELGGMGLLSN